MLNLMHRLKCVLALILLMYMCMVWGCTHYGKDILYVTVCCDNFSCIFLVVQYENSEDSQIQMMIVL